MAGEKLNLYQKLLKITEEVGTIEKTGRNSQQGYAFIEQAQLVAVLRPQLAKWGVFIIPETISRSVDRYEVTRGNGKQGTDVHVKVVSKFTVVDADDPKEKFTVEWDGGEAIDSGDKATNKAITASDKNFLMKLFNISDKEDADNESPEAAPAIAQQAPKPAVGSAAPDPNKMSLPQLRKMQAMFGELGVSESEDRHRYVAETIGREVSKTSDLTRAEAVKVIDRLDGDLFELEQGDKA